MTDPVGSATAVRSAAEVFDDHLRRALARDTRGDIEANYADDCVLLTGIGELRGHDGVRESRATLEADIGDASIEVLTRLVSGEYAFLEWRAIGSDVQVEDGADAFVIRDGLIRMQAIHYTVRHRTGYHRRIAHGARRSEGG